ncbi:hypothetical protein [Oceaniradius stylonematis]|uniref:hypothetical protein n=1 Tax=Oceaniradius stylonematis TaxID=2184161 RepID=UPI000D6C3BF9|nr:hypothetical protein [Oceaniradius stylonematis]
MFVDIRDENFVLPDVPIQSWIIISLEISVKYRGEYYVLMRHPYYVNEGLGYSEGWLYPSFFAFTHSFDTFPPQNAGEWKRETDEALNGMNIKARANELAHLAGLGPLEIMHEGSMFELKSSPSHGGAKRLYRIERYSCKLRNNRHVADLIDPLCLKGHIFVPLQLLEDKKEVSEKEPLTFRGKRIILNFSEAMRDIGNLARIKSRAINIERNDLVVDDEGWILIVDVAGFGRLCDHVSTEQGNIFESGDAIRERFRFTLAELFESVLDEAGCSQTYFTGDGLIAAFPTRLCITNEFDQLNMFMKAYTRLMEFLTEISQRLDGKVEPVGSRLVVHYGQYEFGRVGGPSTVNANFSGDAIVEVARSESALSGVVKDGSLKAEHALGFTESARSRLGDSIRRLIDSRGFEELHLKTKEREVRLFAGPLSPSVD